MARINYIKLIISIVASLLAGVIGSGFTSSSIPTWYALLNKPAFNPPNWIFGPVWTTLYILMGISLYLIWNSKKSNTNKKYYKIGIKLFILQLVLNALWSILFFGLQSPFFALLEIILLWISILMTMYYFSKISKTAMYLLVPYLLWVSFASILNLAIYLIN